MFGKIITALIAALAVVVTAEPRGIFRGYLSSGTDEYGLGGFGSRVLNVGFSVPVVSATPSCAPIATPSAVVDPISTVVAPVVSSELGSKLYGSGLYGSEVSRDCNYNSVLSGYPIGSLLSVC